MTLLRRYAFVPALLVILVATLAPAGEPDTPYGFWGSGSLADIFRNIILFMPLGAALALRGPGLRRIVLLSFGASLFVEACQLVLPGRDPSVFDLASNTAGGWAGAAAWLGLMNAGRFPAWAASLAAGLAGCCLLLTAWLMAPSLPNGAPYFGQWTPNLGQFAWYRGQVLEATLDGEPLTPDSVENFWGMRRRLMQGAELRVMFTAGPPTPDVAPIVSVFDGWEREVALLAVDGSDVIWRLRPRAASLALESPFLRWPGRLAPFAPGETVVLSLSGARPGYCLALARVESCQALGLRDGWMIFVAPDFAPYALHPPIAFFWLALLALPIGLLLTGRGPALGALAILGIAVLAAPPLGGLGVASFFEWGSLLAGLGAGMVLRRISRSRARGAEGVSVR